MPVGRSRRREEALRWRTLIRVTVIGIMFSAALAAAEQTDAELARLKSAVRKLLQERLSL